MKSFLRILSLIASLASCPAVADDRIRIEIGPPSRAVEVISPTFFDERARPPQTIANKNGQMRYYGEYSQESPETRAAWIEECQNGTLRLRDCYKQKQRAAR